MEIQVGDRVTYIETSITVGKYRRYGLGFNTKEVKNKVVEIVTRSNKEYKDILKIERIGLNGWYIVCEKKAEILDEKEKEYLNAVIKPFKSKIDYIKKQSNMLRNKEFIMIFFEEPDLYMDFPFFEKGTMYKNMKLEKEYTLKELGLEE